MALRHFLLGLLSENSGHGYALRKEFLRRLGHFRNINEGQLYTELARMEKDGLIEREVEVPERGPARKLLHITTEGRRFFDDWLRSDDYEDQGVLYDFMHGFPFLSKCSFLNHLSAAEIREKLRRQVRIVERKRKAYDEILERMRDRGADPYRIRILEFGREEMEHRIRWLERIREMQEDSPAAARRGKRP